MIRDVIHRAFSRKLARRQIASQDWDPEETQDLMPSIAGREPGAPTRVPGNTGAGAFRGDPGVVPAYAPAP